MLFQLRLEYELMEKVIMSQVYIKFSLNKICIRNFKKVMLG